MVEVVSGITGEQITVFGDGDADEEHGSQLWVLKESLATMVGRPRFQLKLLQNNQQLLHVDHTLVLGCVQLILMTPSMSDEDRELLMQACLRSVSLQDDLEFLGLLEKPVEVDFVREIHDGSICTPLHVVVEGGKLDYVHLLVEAKANIEREAKMMRYECAIETAAECGFHEIVRFFVACGQSQAMIDRSLLVASRLDLETVQYLVRSGAASVNLTSQGTFDLTPVVHCAYGRSEIVEFLLHFLADCNVRSTDDGETPLMRAADEGHLRIG